MYPHLSTCRQQSLQLLLLLCFALPPSSAQELQPGPPLRPPGSTDLLKFNWQASTFFDDPRMIAAFEAVRKCSLAELQALQAADINWNQQGRHGMTILLLAFLSEDFRIYSQLLEWGADPNLELQLTDDYPIPGDYSFATIISNGDSVMHLATVFPREPKWFSTTLSNRGDIHWVHPIERNNILQTYIARPTNLQPSTEKVQLLISLGSNLNQINSDGNTAALLATSSGNYEVAALLLKAGASADCYDLQDLQLIHHVAIDHRSRLELFENSAAARTNWDQSPLRPGWDELLQLLQERGYSLELAMQDLDRSDELVDGMPYLKWRKLQRAAQDSCKPTTAAAP